MCFRPAGTGQSISCPECGKKINAVLGTMPDTCPFCELDLAELAAGINAGIGGPIPAPAAPVVPGAPSAAPKAPTAPKDLGASS